MCSPEAERCEGRGVAAGVERDVEAGGGDGPGVDGAGDDVGAVVDGFGGVGRGEVGDGDLVAHAGMLLVPVGVGGLAGEERGRGRGRELLGEGGGGAEGESEEGGPRVMGVLGGDRVGSE